MQHLPPQTVVSAKHSQVIDKLATNHGEADVEILNLGSARIMEKQTGDKGNCDFENQLRDIDAEIFGKADTGSNVDTADSERTIENLRVIAQYKETLEGNVLTQGLGSGFNCNGPHTIMGQLEDHVVSTDPTDTYTGAGFTTFSSWAYEVSFKWKRK